MGCKGVFITRTCYLDVNLTRLANLLSVGCFKSRTLEGLFRVVRFVEHPALITIKSRVVSVGPCLKLPNTHITITHLCNIMQYLTPVKWEHHANIFQMKNCDIVLVFAQNIDCGSVKRF